MRSSPDTGCRGDAMLTRPRGMRAALRSVVAFVAIVLTVTASSCGMGTHPGRDRADVDPLASPDPFSGPDAGDEVPCVGASPWFPVAMDDRWEYRASMTGLPDWTWTDTITQLDESRFTLTSMVDTTFGPDQEPVSPQGWICLENGFRRTPTGSFRVAGSSQKVQPFYQGIDLPRELVPDETWSWRTSYVRIDRTAEGQEEVFVTIDGQGKVVGEEDVDTPAGPLTAMRLDIVVTTREATDDVRVLETKETSWYVRDLGLVQRSISMDESLLTTSLRSSTLPIPPSG